MDRIVTSSKQCAKKWRMIMNKKARKLNKENNRLDELIKEENQEIFTNMICYLRGSDLSDYNIEVVRNDLTEMVLSAQERGEGINQVVGNDYKEFCDSIIETFPGKTMFEKVIDIFDTLLLCGAILFLSYTLISREFILMIADIIKNNKVSYNISYSAGSIVSMIGIIIFATTLVHFIMSNSFDENPVKEKIAIGFMFLFLAVVAVGTIFLRNTLFSANVFVMLGVITAMFLAHFLLDLR